VGCGCDPASAVLARPDYYYNGWADMGLPPPDPGFQYVQYGPDLLLVNVSTGEVAQVFPGAFS
jgi:Ni/Co efflux regulator RcnB